MFTHNLSISVSKFGIFSDNPGQLIGIMHACAPRRCGVQLKCKLWIRIETLKLEFFFDEGFNLHLSLSQLSEPQNPLQMQHLQMPTSIHHHQQQQNMIKPFINMYQEFNSVMEPSKPQHFFTNNSNNSISSGGSGNFNNPVQIPSQPQQAVQNHQQLVATNHKYK
jgi:hypothetical protein